MQSFHCAALTLWRDREKVVGRECYIYKWEWFWLSG